MPRSAAPAADMSFENNHRNKEQQTRQQRRREDRTLESVSSLRDTHSGSITEIKVWSQASPSQREDAVSPPIEPVSSQSSTSEDSSNQRPKYTLPPSSRRAETLKKSASGRDVIVETVSSLKEVASASLSDLKEWAATQTRSEPIETVSSSTSSSSESMLDGKPAYQHAPSHCGWAKTTQPPVLNKTSSARSKEALLESVSSLKEAANTTMVGIKEWAATLPKSSRESSEEAAAKETKKLYNVGNEAASPERATRTLYGAQTGYESTQQHLHKDESKNTTTTASSPKKKRAPCSPQLKMMQDLVSPFLVCTSGAAQSVQDDDDEPPTSQQQTYQVDLTLKDRKGESVKESAWMNWNPIIGALDHHRADSFDESILTYDSEAEEQDQIRRMTSWGTMGTLGTQNTLLTVETTRTLETSDGTMVEATTLMDDEGHLIHPVLLETAKKRREQRKQKKKGRKRMVKFDYPPISSLRECPRADPRDLPNLFFTEEELDQIEDDRYDTKIADDVEIVAISSIKSADGSLSDGRDFESDSSSKKISPPGSARFSKYTSTPKLRGKRRPSSPFPRRQSISSEDARSSFECENERPPKTPSPPKLPSSSSTAEAASSSQKEQRLLKGVQIFLRERSTGSERHS